MDLKQLQALFQEYPLNNFVGTPKVMKVNNKQMSSDMENAFSEAAKEYLYCLSDLIKNNKEFYSKSVSEFSNYVSRLIGTTQSLKKIVQIAEDLTNVFQSQISWAKGLAIRSMITILDNIVQELAVIKKQVKSSRFISRLRDKIRFVIWEKMSQMFNILSTVIAVEQEEIAPKEVLVAIGKGVRLVKTC